jgi:hypothetical protein
MADMLTNTVGVVLFILIFTVLTAGGAVLKKRLPMERETKAKPVQFICAFGRIAPMDFEGLIKEFLRPVGTSIDPGRLDEFVTRFKNRKLETDHFIVTGEAGRGLVVIIEPKPGNGETSADLARSTSSYRSILAGLDPNQRYARFVLYPSGVSAVRAARDIASAGDFGTGWELYGADERIRTCIAFCGSSGGPDFVK